MKNNGTTWRMKAVVVSVAMALSMGVGTANAESLSPSQKNEPVAVSQSVESPDPSKTAAVSNPNPAGDANQQTEGQSGEAKGGSSQGADSSQSTKNVQREGTSQDSTATKSAVGAQDSSAAGQSNCVIGQSTVEDCFPDHALMQSVMRAGYAFDDSVFDETVIENVDRAGLDWDGSHAEKMTSLEGIQNFPNLSYLDMPNNNISDLSPLRGMRIGQIDLTHNRIVDASPLWTVHYIENQTPGTWTVNVSQNHISDLTGISQTENLFGLNLQNNDLTNIEPLRGAPSLYQVSLSFNDITDFSPLWPDTSITVLAVNDNPHLTSLKGITALRNLEHLDIMCGYYTSVATGLPGPNGKLASLKDIVGLPALRELDFSGNPITDLTPLEGMNSIVKLDGNSCGIDDLTPLKQMKGLTYVRFMEERINHPTVTAKRGTVSVKSVKGVDGNYLRPANTPGLSYSEKPDVHYWMIAGGDNLPPVKFPLNQYNTSKLNPDQIQTTVVGMVGPKPILPGESGNNGNNVNIAKAQVGVQDDSTASPAPSTQAGSSSSSGPSDGSYDATTGTATWTGIQRSGTASLSFGQYLPPVNPGNVNASEIEYSGIVSQPFVIAQGVEDVTFDSRGGSTVPPQEVNDGDLASKPGDPTKAGMDFKGWSTVADDTLRADGTPVHAYDFSLPVTTSFTLYAQWAPHAGPEPGTPSQGGSAPANSNGSGTLAQTGIAGGLIWAALFLAVAMAGAAVWLQRRKRANGSDGMDVADAE
ncbi:InlB B-repeat-containing protein [Bifidobacterium sp. ESL0790]|uniref:InlB B-repeat-containing protein n=1 Tax=Bifidobacterium sp. ESL0790 TaxID=2983233 RepID=UPI0023F8978C|nr:InlB B-repeat-containing protein [Bifidobacterium sp. ESL0790]WEV72517.1 InlB B-repeat-containing protein [Bifidobacterium sp. ESL0790]